MSNAPTPKPAANEPGTLGEQLAIVFLSLYLGKKRRKTRTEVWQDARRLVLKHARTGEQGGGKDDQSS